MAGPLSLDSIRTRDHLHAGGSKVLLDVMHGSHLYGLAHADSDEDRFIVLSERPGNALGPRKARWAKQTVIDGLDTTTVDLSTFARYASMGAHQYVEAMYADHNMTQVDKIRAFRESFRVSPAMARNKYLGAIFSFSQFDRPDSEPTFKAVRHAFRLAFCWRFIYAGERFDPTMYEWHVETLNMLASMPRDEYLRILAATTPGLVDYKP